jgi:hypothetical protein
MRDDDDGQEIDAEGNHPAIARENHAAQKGDDRQFGGAGNKGVNDRQIPFLFVFDGPGAHDARHGAAAPTMNGMMDFPDKPNFLKILSRKKGDAVHVALWPSRKAMQ